MVKERNVAARALSGESGLQGRLVPLALLGLALSGALGCESPSTQLVVVVNTDYAVPTEMGVVQARISDSAGQEISTSEFVLTDVLDPTDPTRFVLPLSFGVVPVGNDASRRIIVEVDALSASRAPLVTRRAVTGFLAEQTLRLPMFIARACEDVVCPMEETCTELGCVSDVVDPQTLSQVDAGGEFGDGGAMDSAADGGDGSLDGGGMDGATDAGPDARVPLDCTAPCTCSMGYCEVGCSMDMVCDVTCESAGCDVTASDGRDVSVTCGTGATCNVGANRRRNTVVRCLDGSTCAVDCFDSSSCDVQCEGAASCLLTCAMVGPCDISTCGAGAVTCPGGEIVCGRACP